MKIKLLALVLVISSVVFAQDRQPTVAELQKQLNAAQEQIKHLEKINKLIKLRDTDGVLAGQRALAQCQSDLADAKAQTNTNSFMLETQGFCKQGENINLGKTMMEDPSCVAQPAK